jgi:hypothetical protein
MSGRIAPRGPSRVADLCGPRGGGPPTTVGAGTPRDAGVAGAELSTFYERSGRGIEREGLPDLELGMIAVRAPVAQWIERRPPEPKVAGSNPVGRAISVDRSIVGSTDRSVT